MLTKHYVCGWVKWKPLKVWKKIEIVLCAATGTAESLQHGIPDTVEKWDGCTKRICAKLTSKKCFLMTCLCNCQDLFTCHVFDTFADTASAIEWKLIYTRIDSDEN